MATAQRQSIRIQKAVESTADSLADLAARINALEAVPAAVERLSADIQALNARLDTLLAQKEAPNAAKPK